MASSNRLTELQRKEIGQLVHADPNVSRLARQYRVTRDTIRKWLQEGRKEMPDYVDKPRTGRPKLVNQRMKNAMRRLAGKRMPSRQIMQRMAQTYGFRVSQMTVRRVLKTGRQPMHYARIRRGRELRDVNVGKRLEFCTTHAGDDFSKWVFIDAKDVYCYYDAGGRAAWKWQRVGEHSDPLLSNPWVFRVYGAVALGHKSNLIFVLPSPPEGSRLHKSRETYTSLEYIRMMSSLKVSFQHWYPRGGYQIIQDKAKQHTSKASVKALAEMHLPILNDFPPQSWDINIIENCWGMLEGKLLGKAARNTKAWRHEIISAWDKVQQDSIDKLVFGMGERLKAIIAADGKWVKHH